MNQVITARPARKAQIAIVRSARRVFVESPLGLVRIAKRAALRALRAHYAVDATFTVHYFDGLAFIREPLR